MSKNMPVFQNRCHTVPYFFLLSKIATTATLSCQIDRVIENPLSLHCSSLKGPFSSFPVSIKAKLKSNYAPSLTRRYRARSPKVIFRTQYGGSGGVSVKDKQQHRANKKCRQNKNLKNFKMHSQNAALKRKLEKNKAEGPTLQILQRDSWPSPPVSLK